MRLSRRRSAREGSWTEPDRRQVTLVPGQPTEPLLMFSMGSNIRPFMTSEDVEALKVQMGDEGKRVYLAAFITKRVFNEQLRLVLEGCGMLDTDKAREIAYFGIQCYVALTEAVESEEWPSHVSPPEFFETARLAMEAEVNG